MTGLLLVGGAGASTLSVDVAEDALIQARKRGLRSTVTNQAGTLAATPSVSAQADAVAEVDFEHIGESVAWARAAESTAQFGPFGIVFGVREMAQVAVAEIAQAIGVAGNPPNLVRLVRAKDACRATLAGLGLAQPAFRVCADPAEASAFIDRSTGPWVVKPTDAMGSEGVSMVGGLHDLPSALALLPAGTRRFLVEEFVDGPEFSVEGVFIGGVPTVLAVTAKRTTAPPFFVEIGHVLPAELPGRVRADIERRVAAALTALRLRFGLFHVELWLRPTGPVLGEIHVRNAGGWIHRMLPHAIPGLELFGLVYDDVLGIPIDRSTLRPTRGAASRFFTPPPGRLVSVEGFERVRAHPSVLHAELTVEPGAVIAPLRNGEDRVGGVVVGADTPAQARQLAEELAGTVRFVVEPVE